MSKSIHLKTSKIVVISQIECKQMKQNQNPLKYFPILKDLNHNINKTV